MRAEEAARVINEDLALGLDGWKVTAYEGQIHSLLGYQVQVPNEGNRNDVTLYVSWPNVNTDIGFARAGYPEKNDLAQWVSFDVTDKSTPEEILAELRVLILRIMNHEVSEGMRLKSQGYRAPFHPHRSDRVNPVGTARENAAYAYHKRTEDLTSDDLDNYRRAIDGVYA